MKKKTPDTVRKLIETIRGQYKLKDSKIHECYERLNEVSEKIFEEKCIYYSECYKEVTNVTKLRRLSAKICEVETTGENKVQIIETNEQEISVKCTRSKSSLYIKELCVICQKEGGKLRKVAVKSTGKRMLDVAKCLSNKDFFLRLNTITLAGDAIANDVEYHLKCWVLVQREVQNDILNEKDEIQELEDFNRAIADIEIVEMVRESVNSNNVIEMNIVNLTYNASLENEEEINYKKYIKSHMQSNVSNVLFLRPPCRRKAENIHSDQLNKKLVDDHSNKADDFAANFEVAKILRRDIMNLRQWKFNGSFDDS